MYNSTSWKAEAQLQATLGLRKAYVFSQLHRSCNIRGKHTSTIAAAPEFISSNDNYMITLHTYFDLIMKLPLTIVSNHIHWLILTNMSAQLENSIKMSTVEWNKKLHFFPQNEQSPWVMYLIEMLPNICTNTNYMHIKASISQIKSKTKVVDFNLSFKFIIIESLVSPSYSTTINSNH